MTDRFSKEAARLTGRWIRAALQQAGITQAELERRTGISHSQLSTAINSKNAAGMKLVVRILEACGLEIIELRVKKSTIFGTNPLTEAEKQLE